MKEYTTKEFSRAVSRVLNEAEGDSVIIHRRGKPDIELRRYTPEVHTSGVEVHTSEEKVHTSLVRSESKDPRIVELLNKVNGSLSQNDKVEEEDKVEEIRYKWEDGTCHPVRKDEVQRKFGRRWEGVWKGLSRGPLL